MQQRRSTIHTICPVKRLLMDVVMHAKQHRGNPTVTFVRNLQNATGVSIFEHINFMHLVTMSIQFGDLVLLTTTQLCW